MSYVIWCQVRGGPSGFRQSRLEEDGELVTFANHAEAFAAAERLSLQMNSNPFDKATYRYWVESEV